VQGGQGIQGEQPQDVQDESEPASELDAPSVAPEDGKGARPAPENGAKRKVKTK
jgi:hypothetical protein